MNYEQLQEKVLEWADDKQIFAKSTPLKQIQKTLEELYETVEALNKLESIEEDSKNGTLIPFDLQNELEQALFEAQDGIGDMLVTIIILAQMLGLDSVECLESAYNEIKGRTGKMVDGIFVKDQ